jgi:hypothetical protein
MMGYFCFLIKHSTHKGPGKPPFFRLLAQAQIGADARALDSGVTVLYGTGTRLGDLKESWFILFSN